MIAPPPPSCPPEGAAVRLCRPDELTAADHARWAALSARADGGNVFAQSWFMQAALDHCRGGEDVRMAIVAERGEGWLGVLPLARARRFGRWPVRTWRSWTATNQFLGSPLVRSGAEDAFWRALLHGLDRQAWGGVLHCTRFAADDPAAAALIARCAREGRRLQVTDRFDRPARTPGDAPATADASGRKLRARLDGLLRKLAREQGAVAIERHPPAQPVDGWLDAFLALEGAGWKGAAGSALACDPGNAGLFRAVIAHGHANGTARLATLHAGGRTLAMTSWFETGTWGFGFKTAFDERYRRYAPGRLLMRHVAESVAGDPALRFDSCAPRDAAGAHRLWPGRRAILDCAVAVGPPVRQLAFAGMMRATAGYHRLRAGAGGPPPPRMPDRV